MEDEDKHSLKRVEYGEEVCHDNRGLIDEEETKRPRQTQKTQQSEGTHDPGSEGQQTQRVQIQHERRLWRNNNCNTLSPKLWKTSIKSGNQVGGKQ